MIIEYIWAPPWCDADYIKDMENKGWRVVAQNNGYHVRAKESAKLGRPFKTLLVRQVSPVPIVDAPNGFMGEDVKPVPPVDGVNANKGV